MFKKEINIPHDKVVVVEQGMTTKVILDLASKGKYILISSISEEASPEFIVEWCKYLKDAVFEDVDGYIFNDFRLVVDPEPKNGKRNIYLIYKEELPKCTK